MRVSFASLRSLILITVGILPTFLGSKSLAASFPRSRIQIFQQLYSGEKGKSLAEAGSAEGIEIENITDMSILAFYFKFRTVQSTGTQAFYDDTTLVNSTFTYYQGGAELGFYLFPLERKPAGLNAYLGLGGTAGYNYISLDKAISFTALPSSDQGASYGYAVSLGAEWLIKGALRSWALNSNITYRVENAKLLAQPAFNLSGLTLSLGVGF